MGKNQHACSVLHLLPFLYSARKNKHSIKCITTCVFNYYYQWYTEIDRVVLPNDDVIQFIRRKLNCVLFDDELRLLLLLEQPVLRKNCAIRKRKHYDGLSFCFSDINFDKYCKCIRMVFFLTLIIFFLSQDEIEYNYAAR